MAKLGTMFFLSYLVGIIVFLAVVMVSVALHEAGHMSAARVLGMKVPEFFVGFGKTLFSRTRNGTEYGIKMLPLGGFVRILPGRAATVETGVEDKEDKEMEDSLLSRVPPWKRIVVFIAGPAVNLVLGFVVLTGVAWTVPITEATTTVRDTPACSQESTTPCHAHDAGVLPGDVITSVNNTPVTTGSQAISSIKSTPAEHHVSITVNRGGEELTLDVPHSGAGVGIVLNSVQHDRTLGDSIHAVTSMVQQQIAAIPKIPEYAWNTISVLFGEERSTESLASVYTVGRVYGDVASDDTQTNDNKVTLFFFYAGVLNLGLFAVNVIPLVPLDGGRIAIAVVDALKGVFSRITRKAYRPMSVKVVSVITAVGTAVVMLPMILILLVDIFYPVAL